ncbi:MAG: hypothetical protein ACE5HD_00015 [Acidobacteriota bacterium]
MSILQKRPYVRPRIGHSMLRSLWYLFAIGGVLFVAFLLPPGRGPLPSLDGTWVLEVSGHPAGLPPGTVNLLIQGRRYALHDLQPGGSGPARLVEIGRLERTGDRLLLQPQISLHRDREEHWTASQPAVRSLSVRFDRKRLVLVDPQGGGTLKGTGAAPSP